MAFSLNKIQIIGNLGQDAEHRFTTNNKCVSSFSVATTDGYKNKDGAWQNETTWHNVIAWEQSEYMKALLMKGAKFYVEGKLKKRDYIDKGGIKKYITEIISEKLIPLDKTEGTQHEPGQVGSYEKPQDNSSSGNVSDVDSDPDNPLLF
jgi:single-strand DNA-binding protein